MFPVHRNTYVKYIPTYYTDVLTRTFQSVLTILDIKWIVTTLTQTIPVIKRITHST